MKLSQQQLDILNEDGFIVLPELFSTDHVKMLNTRLDTLTAESNPANIKEKNSDEVRMVMAVHERDDLFNGLTRDPRLIEPAYQIRPEPIYIQQTKVNTKAPLSADVWQWHCDFGNHRAKDGIRQPLALNIHVFLDDVTEFNGPICFIPGSHFTSHADWADHEMYYDDVTTSYAVWAVDEQVIRKHVTKAQRRNADRGLVSATGKRGSVVIFFDTTLHCSPANISPWRRAIYSLIVNPVSNAYTVMDRPDYLHHKDLTPVEPMMERTFA